MAEVSRCSGAFHTRSAGWGGGGGTSNWDGMGFLVGSGLTVVHFRLSWELTSTTLVSLAHLRQRRGSVRVPLTQPAHPPEPENPRGLLLRVSGFG